MNQRKQKALAKLRAKGPQDIVITDLACLDCGGQVPMFSVPDGVWAALQVATEWLCLSCISRRLNPELPPTPEAIGTYLVEVESEADTDRKNSASFDHEGSAT